MEKVKALIEGKTLVYVHPKATVFEAAFLMSNARIGAVVVLDDGKLVGIFTERDLLNRVIVPCKDPKTTTISDVMTPKVIVADANQSGAKCLEIMKKAACRHLPIVEGDRLIGIVSIRDLQMHDIIEKDAEIRLMNYLYYYQPPVLEE